jgi:hypothetical protein
LLPELQTVISHLYGTMKQALNPILTLLFLCFFVSASFADNNPSVTLNWNKRTPLLKGGTKNKPATIPSFENAVLDIRTSLPYYKIDIPGVEVSSFELVNPVYAQFTQEETKFLPKQLLKPAPEILITTGVANEKPLSLISFAPIRSNPQNGQPEKLISFEYTYRTQASLKKQGKTNRIYATNSVLSTGQWYKLGVTSTGMYKLDRTTLQNMGINVQNLDPRQIQLYGNGGGILPQANMAHRADDLVQNAIMVVGEQDGTFNGQDYVLFYAEGPHTWKANAAKTTFEHQLNLYSDTTYYFLKVGPTAGLRVNTSITSGTPSATISTFTEHLYHETDKVNLIISGREWYGEEFNAFKTSENFRFDVSDLVPNSEIALTSSVLGVSPAQNNGASFTISLNNFFLGTQNTMGHGGGNYHSAGDPDVQTFKPTLNSLSYNNANLTVNINFDQGGIASAAGYLNYLELVGKRQLKLYGNQTTFRSLENIGPNAVSQFQIDNFQASSFVWDVTNPLRPQGQDLNLSGNTATFLAKTDTLREFITFNSSGISSVPQIYGTVNNQNLHALNSKGNLDMVIVTHPAFYGQATRLANHRQQNDKLKVAVVTTDQVYNEFSSGAQDVTAIRDLMKMVYDRKIQNKTKTADSLIYLLLFGDASYDYKSKSKVASQNRTAKNTNFVPVYEARQSLNPLDTYSSEDYFGLLDDLEGEWSESSSQGELLDIGIGRLPAQNEVDARTYVNKLIAYDNPDHYGKWRNRISFVADDEDGNEHLRTANTIASIVETNYQDYNISKIYLDTYSQIPVANGKRSPDCAAALDEAVEQGSLIVNYNGHGGETGWTGEQVLTVNQVNSWINPVKPTFMLTATCEFGRYDDPRRSSASELAILNPNGGAIGMLTTTRPVFASYNEILNKDFFNTVFEPVNGRMPRIGDIYKTSKNKNASSTQVNNRNFTLLCDPSMRLAYPEEKVALTSVQVMDGTVVSDTIKALAKVTITGKVTDKQNQTLANFEGKVNITVFEKPSIINTLGDGDGYPEPIKVLKNVVYEGVATTKNGLFSSTFIVPKDIAYNYGKGKISLYASSANTDAHGSKTDIIIGGAAKNIALDTIPPVIKLFMDNESFVFGGLTGQDALLISHLSDSSGINTVGLGIGHEITATLDGRTENVKVLNEQYVADIDNFRSGKVRYLFKSLSKGPHELRLKAWDNHNNSSEKRIEFIVANTESIALDHVLNYPNPFSTNTIFHFDHNRAGEDLDIQIQIFTVSGKLIKTLAATSFGSKPHIAEISWNGRDDFGDVLAKGVYVYKLTIRSIKDGSKVSKYEKMVILN